MLFIQLYFADWK